MPIFSRAGRGGRRSPRAAATGAATTAASSGAAIPPISRVLACADVYDALTASRPYRDPMPSADALDLMRREVGSAFFAEPFAALDAHVAALRLAA